MARIRTVKPELFKHEGLFNAEIATKLPLRLAFVALLTCCDREGRFKWRPQRLKLDLLPYDEGIEVLNVLNALADHGFINKYQVGSEYYGFIPTWAKHQRINHREADSELPAPKDYEAFSNNISQPHVEATAIAVPANGDNILASSEAKLVSNNILPEQPAAAEVLAAKQTVSEALPNNSPPAVHVTNQAIAIHPATTTSTTETQVWQVFNHWRKVMQHVEARLDRNRQKLITNAMQMGYSPSQLCQAITGCSLTPHNIGCNPNSQRYDGLQVILRDAEQIDRFMQNCHNPPKTLTKEGQLWQHNIKAAKSWLQAKIKGSN